MGLMTGDADSCPHKKLDSGNRSRKNGILRQEHASPSKHLVSLVFPCW